MNAKRRRLLLAAIDPLLEAGERVEVTAIVNLNPVSVRRTAVFAAASALMSGGAMAVVPARVPMYLGMTGHRLFIFEADPMFAKPKGLVLTTPRAGLVRSEIKERVLNSSFVVSSPGSDQGLRIIFPLMCRKERDAVAAALPLAAA
ncbi:hypothetical protein [Streptomyces thermolilacinus]|uniref:Uncharacterized protein n=1 Tax=Streptomyces thermolilacinus SPC6 TaxID=1306406 RepID=A0A1D3DZ91_9ACTN|nr:hypothetical protein [Streptomyces thermolilacinus]OEJ97618.1 hypothetical protein J116_027350 [Streptomyces thermolilacinus SPC6]